VLLRVRLIITRDKNVLIRGYVAAPLCVEALARYPNILISQATLSGSVQYLLFPSIERNLNGRVMPLSTCGLFNFATSLHGVFFIAGDTGESGCVSYFAWVFACISKAMLGIGSSTPVGYILRIVRALFRPAVV